MHFFLQSRAVDGGEICVFDTGMGNLVGTIRSKPKDIDDVGSPEDFFLETACLAAVKRDGEQLLYVPKALKTEKMCLAAVEQCGRAFRFVPYSKRSPGLCRLALQEYPQAILSLHRRHRTPVVCFETLRSISRMTASRSKILLLAQGCARWWWGSASLAIVLVRVVLAMDSKKLTLHAFRWARQQRLLSWQDFARLACLMVFTAFELEPYDGLTSGEIVQLTRTKSVLRAYVPEIIAGLQTERCLRIRILEAFRIPSSVIAICLDFEGTQRLEDILAQEFVFRETMLEVLTT